MKEEKEVQLHSQGINSGNEVLLMCKKMEIQHRIFCFELKEINSRLQFLRIAQNKFSISLPSNGISAFLDALEFLSSSFQKHHQPQQHQGFIKDKELKIDDKVWEASASAHKNTGISIPSANNGWEVFKKTLAEIHTTSIYFFPPIQRECFPAECSSDAKVESIACASAENSSASQSNVKPSESTKCSIVESKMMRAGSKKFFFDPGSNTRGHFLKITEVMGPNRFSIIVPMSSLQQFHEMLGHFLNCNDDSLNSTSLQQSGNLHISDSEELNLVEEDSASGQVNWEI